MGRAHPTPRSQEARAPAALARSAAKASTPCAPLLAEAQAGAAGNRRTRNPQRAGPQLRLAGRAQRAVEHPRGRRSGDARVCAGCSVYPTHSPGQAPEPPPMARLALATLQLREEPNMRRWSCRPHHLPPNPQLPHSWHCQTHAPLKSTSNGQVLRSHLHSLFQNHWKRTAR